MNSDACVFVRSKPFNEAGNDGHTPNTMIHMFQIPFCDDVERLGYKVPENVFIFFPVVPRPRSVGRLYLKSNDPNEKPALDFRYYTDGGYDSSILVAGIKASWKIASQAPFSDWIKREIAPGPEIIADEELDEYARRASSTVYHPACTTKMADTEKDPLAVVDSQLRVRGIKGLRIADAGVLPDMISVNPMLTVLCIGERAAELIAADGGWGKESAKI